MKKDHRLDNHVDQTLCVEAFKSIQVCDVTRIKQREHTELETAILRGDYLARVELENVFGQIAEGILQVIKSSGLSKEAQDDIRHQIAAIPCCNKKGRTSTKPARGCFQDGGISIFRR